jgi:hypothetical protein
MMVKQNSIFCTIDFILVSLRTIQIAGDIDSKNQGYLCGIYDIFLFYNHNHKY